MPLTQDELHLHVLELMYSSGHVVGIIPQSIVYGIYVILISISSYMMPQKGQRSRIRRALFIMTLVMFAHATFYMVISILDLILFIEAWFLDPNPIGFTAGVDKTLPIAIGLLNYVLTDSVVVWRAWVLCREEYMRGLVVSLWFLVFASVSALSTIGIRIALLVVLNPSHASNVLTRVINITQVANLAFSLLTNIVATSIVAIKAWRHKQFFTEMRIRDAKTHTSRVMALLIESGIFYSISLVAMLIATLIRLPVGTVGALYTPVNIQLAGMYPIIVLLLVNQGGSLDRTHFVSSGAATHVHVSTDGNANHTVSTVLFRSAGDVTVTETDEATAMSVESSASGSRNPKSRQYVCKHCGREDEKKEQGNRERENQLPEVRSEPFEVSVAEFHDSA